MATTIQPTVNENFGMSQSIIWKCEKVTEWQGDRGQGGRVTGWQGDRVDWYKTKPSADFNKKWSLYSSC